MNMELWRRSVLNRCFVFFLAVGVSLTAFLLPTNIALAEDWEDWWGYVGTNPNFFDLPTEIEITDYNLHFTDNKNDGSLLFCWKIEPWDGSIPYFLSNVGFSTSCNYKMTCIILFKVNNGFQLEGTDLSPNYVNVVPYVSVSGMRLLFDTNNVKVVPQPQYSNSKVFDFPNSIPINSDSNWRVYASNSRKIATVVYATRWQDWPQSGNTNNKVLGQTFEVYYSDSSASASLTNVSDDVINRMEFIVNNNPSWISIGYPMLCMMMSRTEIGNTVGVTANAKIIENFLSYVSVSFDGSSLTSSQLKHLSDVQSYQDYLQNGSYEDWISLKELNDHLDNNILPTLPPVNNIEDLFTEIDPSLGGFNVVLSALYDDNNIVSIISVVSLSFGVLSLIVFGTVKA